MKSQKGSTSWSFLLLTTLFSFPLLWKRAKNTERPPNPHETATVSQDLPAAPVRVIVDSLPPPIPPSTEQKAKDDKKELRDRIKYLAELVVGFFVIIYTIVTIGLWCEQHKATVAMQTAAEAAKSAADIAQKQLEMSERPWVVTEYAASAPFQFNPDGSATFRVLGKMTNIGHSVALFVHDTPLISLEDPGVSGLQPTKPQKETCDLIREMGEKYPSFAHGETLFPQEFAYMSYPLTFTKEQIEKAKIGKTDELLGLRIIGCVDYMFSFSTQHHQTGYIYEISKLPPPSPSSPLIGGASGIKIGSSVPINELQIRRSLFGGFYAD